MEYYIDGYFAKRTFENVDEVTGLVKELRATGLVANAKQKFIEVSWELVLLSPENCVMEVKQTGSFKRFNGVEPKYDNLKNSAIGQGIKGMIEQLDFATVLEDLSNFPDCLIQDLGQ